MFLRNIKLSANVVTLRTFSNFFITSPIFYPNDTSDVIARWQRYNNKNVIFSTGTDEHGIKIQRSAQKNGTDITDFITRKTNQFKSLFDSSDVSYTDFIKTSDLDHISTVNDIWKRLMLKRLFAKTDYSGWYSVTDEEFISDTAYQVLLEKDSPEIGKYEWYEEKNWIFDITQFKQSIGQWIESSVFPAKFRGIALEYLSHMGPISVSRPNSRVSWGVPVPNDPDQTIYVWFDALINYITVSKRHQVWPPDLQIVGKDILRFHAIVWPAILMALDMDLPKKLLVHSHWLCDGVKMSKSLGNAVDLEKELRLMQGNTELLRYGLLSQDTIHDDSNYDRRRMVMTTNAELVNTLANLVARICGVKLNPDQKIGFTGEWRPDQLFVGSSYGHLTNLMEALPARFTEHMSRLELHLAKDAVQECARAANIFLTEQQPWQRPTEDCSAVLWQCAEAVRRCSLLLQCFVPRLADQVLYKLAVPEYHCASIEHLSSTDYTASNVRHLNQPGQKVDLLRRIHL